MGGATSRSSTGARVRGGGRGDEQEERKEGRSKKQGKRKERKRRAQRRRVAREESKGDKKEGRRSKARRPGSWWKDKKEGQTKAFCTPREK